MAEALVRLRFQDTEIEEARKGSSFLECASAAAHGGLFLTKPDGENVLMEMPASLLAAMKNFLATLAEPGETLVLTSEAEVSPERAAEILGISRPLVDQRMDSGRLPFRRIGGRRSIRTADVAALKLFEDQRRSFASALSADTEDLEEHHATPDKSVS